MNGFDIDIDSTKHVCYPSIARGPQCPPQHRPVDNVGVVGNSSTLNCDTVGVTLSSPDCQYDNFSCVAAS